MAVVDVETMGLSRYDRIVEFACVTVVDGAVVDEYDTLIQADRDTGPVHIHGITPQMLQSAPKFDAVAGDIADRVNGAVLVAHNISFDVRMLTQEVDRLGLGGFDPGQGLCTYRLTGQKLSPGRSRRWFARTEPHRPCRRPHVRGAGSASRSTRRDAEPCRGGLGAERDKRRGYGTPPWGTTPPWVAASGCCPHPLARYPNSGDSVLSRRVGPLPRRRDP